MVRRSKIWVVLLTGMALVAIVLLASSLSDIRLKPGELSFLQSERPHGPTQGLRLPGEVLRQLWQIAAVLMLILLPVAIIYAVLNPEMRRRAVVNALVLTAAIMAYYMWLRNRAASLTTEGQPLYTPPTAGSEGSPFLSGNLTINPPEWLVILILAGVIALVLVVFILLMRVWFRQRPTAQLEEIALEARHALEDLEAGADLRDTITRCYFEMSRTLDETRGIRREKAMTPREFQARLRVTGLSPEYVRRLTYLFEMVRYGAHTPGQREQDEAIACLAAVIKVCRGAS